MVIEEDNDLESFFEKNNLFENKEVLSKKDQFNQAAKKKLEEKKLKAETAKFFKSKKE